MKHAPTNAWLAYSTPNPQALVRLFCFPYAGGGAAVYRGWQRRFPSGVDLCLVQLPGRETRLKERPYSSLPPLVQAAAEGLKPYFDVPFVFFGHSMGSLISFELIRHLRREGRPLPQHLFASGSRAPHIPKTDPPRHVLPDDEFMEELRGLSGTPEAVLQNAELMRFLIPILRADFSLFDTYQYTEEPPLPCSISVFGGYEDPDVSEEHLEAWQDQTHGNFALKMFPGNHFYLQSAQESLLEVLNQELLRVMYRLQGGAGK